MTENNKMNLRDIKLTHPNVGKGNYENSSRSIKVSTKGKTLSDEMQKKVARFIEKNRALIIVIAKEHAMKNQITVELVNGQPEEWFADLVSAGVYGMCIGALAWQQKETEGRKTTDFDGELKQAARVRVKQMVKKIARNKIISEL